MTVFPIAAAFTLLPLGFGFAGPLEVAVIALVVLLLFGNKLPGMARNLGRSFVEFKKGIKGSPADEGRLPRGQGKSREDEARKREKDSSKA